MEELEYFLKISEINTHYVCIVSIHYVPLILDVVRVVQLRLKLIYDYLWCNQREVLKIVTVSSANKREILANST